MSPQLKAGIESNVANKIVFGLNLDEAREMAKYTLEIDKKDFYSLPPFWAYIRTEISPNAYRWIIGKAYPPKPKIRDSRTPFLNSLSRYGQDISEIECQFENYIFEKSASKNENSNSKLIDLGRRKRSNRSSNRVDEENSSTPDK